MAVEIERKFLVSGEFTKYANEVLHMAQGYLSSNKERTVRVRIANNKGFITIKGKSSSNGLERYEWEKEIPQTEANDLLKLCEKGIIKKKRYVINYKQKTFEVDVFEEENKGLILAELELNSQDESFELPSWIGLEVTGDKRYYNSYLAKHPFVSW